MISPNSTEVFLPGMSHSENPAGLLPKFSSWSLVSIGKSSQYNPHSGRQLTYYLTPSKLDLIDILF